MPLQLNVFLLLFGGLQGLLFSAFLIRKKAYREEAFLLSLYVVVMVLQILLKVASKVWLMEHARLLYSLSYYFPVLYGPLVYLLTERLLNKKNKPTVVWVHFVPFGLSLVTLLIGIAMPATRWYSFLFMGPRIMVWINISSTVVYHVLAYQTWRRVSSRGQTDQTHWVSSFIVGSAAVCMSMTIAIYFMYVYYPVLTDLKWVFIGISVFVYWISFTIIRQPDILCDATTMAETDSRHLVVHRPGKRYHNSGLSVSETGRIIAALQTLIEKDRVFLDPDISIEGLSQRISCTRHHLSQVLNEKYHQTFYDFINQRRVTEARRLLSSSALQPMKIAAVAYDSGFSSISSFNEVFKKLTGLTPSQFRDQPMAAHEKQWKV